MYNYMYTNTNNNETTKVQTLAVSTILYRYNTQWHLCIIIMQLYTTRTTSCETYQTEKDSHERLNHRTVSILLMILYSIITSIYHYIHILAGIHSCGIITIIGELFGAESKGQV